MKRRTQAAVVASFRADVVPGLRPYDGGQYQGAWRAYLATLARDGAIAATAERWPAPRDLRPQSVGAPERIPASAIDRRLARALIAFMLHTPDGERFGAKVRALGPGSITAAPHRMAALGRIVDDAVLAFDRTFPGGGPFVSPETRAYVAAELYRRFLWVSRNRAELAQVDPTESRTVTWRGRFARRTPARPGTSKANRVAVKRWTKAQAVADFRATVVPNIWLYHGRENIETLGYAWRRYLRGMVAAGRLAPSAVDWPLPTRRR